MSSEEEITRLFRVKRTLLQMLLDRGYNIDESEVKFDLNTFCNKYGKENIKREVLAEVFPHKETSDQIYIFFPDEPNVGVGTLKSYLSRMKGENVSKAILVVQKKLTPFARTTVNDVRAKFELEVFEEEELLVNITHHVLVPKHEVLNSDEKKALLEQHSVKEVQLPRMLKKDPIARYYGLKFGQVVKITRDSETAGKYVTYRIVV